MMQTQVMPFNLPQNPQFHLKSYKLTLQIFIALNRNNKEKYQGEGRTNNA